ncbi:MAG: hypothetical protein ACREL9_11070 [Gemmatimonadales bacterium]
MMRRSTVRGRFAVCVKNEGYPASLERWKIYQVIPDRDAERQHQIWVIDESGEDYLYPRKYFRLVALPAPLRRLFLAKAVA